MLALRHGSQILELREYRQQSTAEPAGHVHALLDSSGAVAVIDSIGIGDSLITQLRNEKSFGKRLILFGASQRTTLKDAAGVYGFMSCRDAAWFRMRDLLNPENPDRVALPPDDQLKAELSCPTATVNTGGRYKVESKDELRKRLGRSTDKADAVVQAFWADVAKSRLQPVIPTGIGGSNYWRDVG